MTAVIAVLWVTAVAAFHTSSPACLAVIVQVPAVRPVMVVPLTAQVAGVAVVRVTGRPDVAVAVAVPTPDIEIEPGRLMLMAWERLRIVALALTGVAAFQDVLPAWLAVMVQVPPISGVTVVPDTEQTVGVSETSVTGRPELDDAAAVMLPSVTVREVGVSDSDRIWVPLVMVALRIWVAAAFHEVLPAWLAWIEQVPASSGLTVLPETEQIVGVVEVSVTGRPEEAVAVAAMLPEPSARAVGFSENVMDCEPCRMVALLVTLVAAFHEVSPAWLARMEQVPAATGVTVVPATEQIAGVVEVSVTGRPDEAVAVAAIVPRPRVRAVGLSENVMVCGPLRIVAFLVMVVAAFQDVLPG